MSFRQSEVSKNDLKKYDVLFSKIEKVDQSINQLRASIETLHNKFTTFDEQKVDKSNLKLNLDQVRVALGEINQRMKILGNKINSKADLSEMNVIKSTFVSHIQSSQDTAASSENLRCLTCGQHRFSVSQAIDDPLLQQHLSHQTVLARITDINENGNCCFVYGDSGEPYFGRSPTGKPILSKPSFSSLANQSHPCSLLNPISDK